MLNSIRHEYAATLYPQRDNYSQQDKPARPKNPRRRQPRKALRCLETLEARNLLAGDLVAQWRGDSVEIDGDGQLTAWVDSVAGIRAEADGDATLIEASIGGRPSVAFEGGDGADLFRVDSNDNPLGGAADYTVAILFATTHNDATGADGAWFSHMGLVDSSNGGFAFDWGVSLNSEGRIASGMGNGFGNPPATVYSAEQGLTDGEPHVAIISRSGGSLSVSIDNGDYTTLAGASTVARAANIDFAIGGVQNILGTIPYTGEISEVRLYNGGMDQAEARALHDELLSFYNNTAPMAADDFYPGEEDPLLFIVPASNGVLANDTDADGDNLTATLVTPPNNGTLTLNADGGFVYDPDRDFFGIDTFTYAASDFRPGNVATVTIELASKYDPAVAIDDIYKSLPTETLQLPSFVGVLANDLNPDDADLAAVVVDDVGQGQLTLGRDGSLSYDPQGFAGTTQFTYRIEDGTGVSAPGSVTLQINTPPEGTDDTIPVTEDIPLVAAANNGVLANDLDADGDLLQATLLTEPINGTLDFAADGSFTYTPNSNYHGPDRFQYQIADAIDTAGPITVTLNVEAFDDPPVASADLYAAAPGTAVTADLQSGVLRNDRDIDSTELTARVVQPPSNGTLQLQPDGSFVYQPNPAFVGADQFQYVANDGNRDSEPTTVQLYIGTTPVQISEIMTASTNSLVTRTRPTLDDSFRGDEVQEDWIELRNLTAFPIDLAGFHLTDDPDELSKWQFPGGTVVPASGHLTVFASRLNLADPALDELGMVHTNFTLRVEGEYLALTSPTGNVLDSMDNYPRQVPEVSYGRTDDGSFGYFRQATPNQANGETYAGVLAPPNFSVQRGFYTAAQTVVISSPDEGVEIRYTTDGSSPTAENGVLYADPIEIGTTTNLRAIALKDGFVPSSVTTNTYLFLNDVLNQGNSPEGYPDQFGLGLRNTHPWEPRPADYEMDPEITQDPAYRDIMIDAMTAVPSISITTSIDNLFDRETGIYQNTDGHGVAWERPASIEMILPDGSSAFQIDAGLRIQGGASREPWKNPKHGFRLKFKGIYGYDELAYDWFGGAAADEFDELVLRAGANQAYTHHNNFLGDNRGRAQYIRDQWVNDTYRAMGHASPHNDYAHLYVNGLYWGLYNPKERPTADFMADYQGGSSQDYDVVNAGALIDGNLDRWRELNSRDFRDLEDPALYDQFTQLLDVDSFADYMIMQHYGGNMDWDSHNWYAAANRNGGKFTFVPWDGEFVFIGLNDNRIRTRESSPGRLLANLLSNDEFGVFFADRIQQHLFNDGLLTPDSVVQRWEARSDQIFDAIIGESARWGDFRRDVDRQGIAPPFELLERDVQWMAERQRPLDRVLPARTDVVIQQYRRANLFPDTDAPAFSQRGGRIENDDLIALASEVGTIYYTIDGSDPRLPGGAISAAARAYTQPFSLDDSAEIRARVLNGEEWSAIDVVSFVVDALPADATNLRVSEVHFNPGAPSGEEAAAGHDNNDDFEFVELTNIANSRIDLTGVRFGQVQVEGETQGLDFAFAESTTLEPGESLIVVEDVEAFRFRYGDLPRVAGQWIGRLSNGGEQITLLNGDSLIQQFTYDDAWHETTDGNGFSLVAADVGAADLSQWNQASGWRASGRQNGTPGTHASAPVRVIGDSNGDGVFDSSDLVAVFAAGKYEDAVPGNATFEEGDWNDDGDFTTADLVHAFGFGTYLVGALEADKFRPGPWI